MEVIVAILIIIFSIILFLLPIIIAISRNHPNKVAIILINVLVGWTGIGWLIALIWSVLAIPSERSEFRYSRSDKDRDDYRDMRGR